MKSSRQPFNSLWRSVLGGILIGALGLLCLGCFKQEPIRIGFVADLTGSQAELGVQERNGVQLAVDKINRAGGIAGKSIELIIRNDLGTPDGAKKADRELIASGVTAIIGHATSQQTIAGLEITNPAQVLLLSPTTSTPNLGGNFEYFFRVYPTFSDSAKGFATHIYKNRKITNLAILYDTDNKSYTTTYKKIFADQYLAVGGSLPGEISFSAAAKVDFNPLLSQLRANKVDGLLLITSDIDAAMIVQRARLMGWQIPVFASAWAQTASLIYNGGQAVEGMEIEQAYALNSQAPDFLAFKQRYQDRFGQLPSFGATFGYEAAMVLASALQKTGGKSQGLRQAMLETKNFKGLIDTFSFNESGDVVRPFYLSVIRDNNFVVLQPLAATEQ